MTTSGPLSFIKMGSKIVGYEQIPQNRIRKNSKKAAFVFSMLLRNFHPSKFEEILEFMREQFFYTSPEIKMKPKDI